MTRRDDTEFPVRNEYHDNDEAGIYVDISSGEPLLSSLEMYDSGTGWPSFYKPLEPGNVTTTTDYKLGYPRKDRGREIDARINIVSWPLVELRHAFYMDAWPVDGLGSAELHLYGEYERPEGFGTLRFDNGTAWEESFDYATAQLRKWHAPNSPD